MTSSFCSAQNEISRDSSLKIRLAEFNIKIVNSIYFMQKLDTLNNVQDAIEMIRLYTTISFNPTMKADIYTTYTELFFEKYLKKSAQLLHALPTKGMALYSKEYDLYIGGHPHTNSQYQINK